MPGFANIAIEEVVQEQDKTRLDGSGSFESGGSKIKTLEIQPTGSEDFYDVSEFKILDWQFPFECQVTDENNTLSFSEGAGELVATIPADSYAPADLAEAIQTAMRAAGALLYVVSVSSRNVFTIAAPSNFSLLGASASEPETSILPFINLDGRVFPELGTEVLYVLGDTQDLAGGKTYSGREVESFPAQVTLKLTMEDDTVKEIVGVISVISELADSLWSSDQKLRAHEPDVLSFVEDGRSTFKNVHRRVQGLILSWMDKEGYMDIYRRKYGKKAILDVSEVVEIATAWALHLIFVEQIREKDDVFTKKADKYLKAKDFWMERAVIRLDIDSNKTLTIGEEQDMHTCVVARR